MRYFFAIIKQKTTPSHYQVIGDGVVVLKNTISNLGKDHVEIVLRERLVEKPHFLY